MGASKSIAQQSKISAYPLDSQGPIMRLYTKITKIFFLLILLSGCAPKTPSLLAEWATGNLHAVAWSPDSKMFVINYWIDNDDSNSYVQAFNVKSLGSMWVVNKSLASDITFTPDGQFTVESNEFGPFFYWRNIKSGEVVRQGEFTDISQIKDGDCSGGGGIIVNSLHKNIALIADYLDLIGPSWRTNNTVVVRQLDLETGRCKNLFNYQGTFDLFDLDSSGTILAYGGEGKDDSVILWNVEKQESICRIPQVEFGRFVPSENILSVIREQKIVFIDTSDCKEIRALNVSPKSKYENYLAFSPDGKQFAIAQDSIEIRDTLTGAMQAQILFPKNAVPDSSKLFLNGIKFSPDGYYLLLSYYPLGGVSKGQIQLWQLK